MGPLGNKAGLTKSRDMLITSRDRIQELKSDLLKKKYSFALGAGIGARDGNTGGHL
jgi:hypothetical protein